MKIKLLLILLISLKSFSQNDKHLFYGKTHDAISVLQNAHIINKTSKSATYADHNGEFKLSVKIGDSIKITSIGYITLNFKIAEKHLGIIINNFKMIKEIIELDEIEIKKHYLTGSLYNDVNHVKDEKIINAKTLKLPNSNNKKFTVAERRLYTANSGLITSLINTISGRKKILKKLLAIEKQEKEIDFLEKTFKKYILNDLKIDSLDVHRFIYYSQEDENYKVHKKKGIHSLIEFFKQKSIDFKNLN